MGHAADTPSRLEGVGVPLPEALLHSAEPRRLGGLPGGSVRQAACRTPVSRRGQHGVALLLATVPGGTRAQHGGLPEAGAGVAAHGTRHGVMAGRRRVCPSRHTRPREDRSSGDTWKCRARPQGLPSTNGLHRGRPVCSRVHRSRKPSLRRCRPGSLRGRSVLLPRGLRVPPARLGRLGVGGRQSRFTQKPASRASQRGPGGKATQLRGTHVLPGTRSAEE